MTTDPADMVRAEERLAKYTEGLVTALSEMLPQSVHFIVVLTDVGVSPHPMSIRASLKKEEAFAVLSEIIQRGVGEST